MDRRTQFLKRLHIKIYTAVLFEMATGTGTDDIMLPTHSAFPQTDNYVIFLYLKYIRTTITPPVANTEQKLYLSSSPLPFHARSFLSSPLLSHNHRLSNEVRFPKIIWAPVYSCTHWLRPRRPQPTPPPAFGLIYEGAIYWSAKIDEHLFVTPCHTTNLVRPYLSWNF
jgi:hypothetical protein